MSALTEYGVELSVELGIGRQANRAVWDTARWDSSAVWGNPDTSLGDWVEVTCDTADPFTLAAGASEADGVVTRWEAATCSLRLLGAQYDPWSGPYAGIVGPMVPLRVRWRPAGGSSGSWLAAFTGAVAADGWDWTPGKRPEVQVSATDSTQVLAAYDPVEQPATGTGDTAAARIGRILDLAGWPSNLRDITAGGVKLKSSTMADVIWTQLLQVADTDLALLWVRRDGRVAFRPEGRVAPGTVLPHKLVICDNPGSSTDVQVVTIGGAQFSDIRNVVSVSRQKEEGGAEASTATELSSALDEVNVPAMLLTLEPDMTLDVEDTSGTVWREGCIGWHVTVGRRRIEGTIELVDMTKWVGAKWDTGTWDTDKWSYAVTLPALEEEE
jgi:hypothetical protein